MTDQPPDEAIAAQIRAPLEVLLQHDEPEWTLVIRRRFPHPPEKLWRMITQPESLARWSPVVPDRPLTTTGPATCRENPGDDPLDASVLIADPPRKLVHRWGPGLLEWTITGTTQGAALELRQTLSDHDRAGRYAAGWQVCLGRLAAEDEGVQRERVVGERARAYGCQALIEQHRNALAAQRHRTEN